MKVSDIIEEGYSAHLMIQRCYKVLSWSGKQLSEGNSGMVAYAIADFLNSKYKIPVKLAILSQKGSGIVDICDLNDSTALIYHVLVKFGSGMFDEKGQNNINKLLNFAGSHHKDDDPDFWNNIDIYQDSCVLPIIGKHTNWDTDWREFKQFLQSKFK